MHPLPSTRMRVGSLALSALLSIAAWTLTAATWPVFHQRVGVFFTAAAFISAAAGGMTPAVLAAILNTAALNYFAFLNRTSIPGITAGLWSVLLVTVSLMVGYAREKWSIAEMRAGRLSTDLARVQDELDSQRADLKRFHDASVRLSSSLELQRLLSDVLTSIAALQKTDLAMLLLLPNATSRNLRVETYAGFTAEQIRLFGDIPASFFPLQRSLTIEDIDRPATYFPFIDAALQIGFRAVFSMPISNSKGEPLGVVVTFFRNAHSPSERQSRLVELYVRQAANALDNAQLYRSSLETLAVEQRRTAVLRSLAEASLQINSALTLDSLLQVITDQARNIIGAHQAFTTLLPKGAWNQSITCTSLAEGETAIPLLPEASEIFMLACSLNKPVRLPEKPKGNDLWRTMSGGKGGWLAAPLLTRDGRNLGLIQLSRKINGDFSEDDEFILVQLTHMASVAVDNVRLYREAQEQIAETKRAQEALQRSKESMQLAQRCVGIGIWEWHLQSGTLVWSDEICRLHGIEPESFDGKYESWMESIHPEDRQQVHRSITQAMAQSADYEVQYRVIFSGKNIHWLEARGQTIVIGDTSVRMLGVAMDITTSKLAEEALLRSEKIAATGRLAASIAHEINNPLAAVTNVLYILRTRQDMPKSALEFVRVAEQELARVSHITKQTLAFYREVSAPVLTSVPSLLDEVLSVYSRNIEEKRATILRRYGHVEELLAFPGELRQVFSNLVLNALEAVPMTGKVAVRVRRDRSSKSQPGLRITIADDGSGISPENMPRIFEPFFTTKDSKGTGLGLWVSQGIIQKHGGTVRVRSRDRGANHGTCFTVFLPFAVFESRSLQTSRQSSPNTISRGTAAGSTSDLSVA
ncbi:MAG TPA: ATP-binding protein [Candidatus Angelobacter sp.]|jgi:PAS domain S-box-containing protein|nr:ATP-binding protein [Candidatus Angelobacter sp.]